MIKKTFKFISLAKNFEDFLCKKFLDVEKREIFWVLGKKEGKTDIKSTSIVNVWVLINYSEIPSWWNAEFL